MEIVKDHYKENEYFVVKGMIAINDVAEFNETVIYIPVSEFTEMVKHVFESKNNNVIKNPFFKKIIGGNGI